MLTWEVGRLASFFASFPCYSGGPVSSFDPSAPVFVPSDGFRTEDAETGIHATHRNQVDAVGKEPGTCKQIDAADTQKQSESFVTHHVMEVAFEKGITNLATVTGKHMVALEERIADMESLVFNSAGINSAEQAKDARNEPVTKHKPKPAAPKELKPETKVEKNVQQDFQQQLGEKLNREVKQAWSDVEPKRPIGAYFLWLAQKRRNHEGAIGKNEANEWCKQWQVMSQIERKPFIEMEETLQRHYQEELAEFRQNGRYRVRHK